MKGKVVMALVTCSLLIFLVPFISAEKTVKTIEGYFGYIPQTTADQLYWKLMTVDPPDGIESIIDAQILVTGDFQAQTGIKAKIQNQFCSPNTWTTPNIDTPNYNIIFDCFDVAQNFKGGEINLSFSTDKIAQNVVGTYKMTYKNNPFGFMKLMGTEYFVGDYGTIFLQLRDSQGLPVNEGSCYADIYYPFGANTTHEQMLNNAPMMYLNNSDGLYYYDLIVPDNVGVYMLSARCSYAYDIMWVYPVYETTDEPYRTEILGVYTGVTLPLNSLEDWIYTECYAEIDVAGKTCEAYYDFNISEFSIDSNNITNMDLFYAGESSADPTLVLYVWNWTNSSWIELENTLTYHATSGQSGYPSGINEFATNELPINDTIQNDVVRIRARTNGAGAWYEFMNWLSIQFLTAEGSIQDLKGSGEIHVSNALVNLSVNLNVNASETLVYEIWNYSNRTTQEEYQLIVSGTEYNSNETGTLYAQFLRTVAGSPSPINNGICNITIYYPDETIFVNNQNMQYMSGSNAIYKYNFTVPETEGVYVADVSCRRGGIKAYSSETYHVGEWANRISTGNITINATTDLSLIESLLNDVLNNQSTIYNEILNVPVNVWGYTNRTLTVEDYEIAIGGTEYTTGDEATAWVILYKETSSGQHVSINDADCGIYIRYPNATNYIVNASMTYISGSFGIYRYNFTVPNVTGNYFGGALCEKLNKEYITSGTFHVTNYFSQLLGNQTQIYNYMVSMNQSIYNKLIEIQIDIANITFDVNLTEVINLINSLNTSIQSYVDDHNTSIWNELTSIQIDLQNILNNQDDILNNQTTIYVELTNINVKLTDVLNNQTTLLNYMVSMNSSLYNKMVFLENLMLQINGSLWNKLFLIQDELANITTLITEVGQNVTTTNSSIHTHIDQINASIFIKLDEILTEIQNIDVNTTALENLILNLNLTLHSHLDANNLTVMTKLYSIQTELQQIINNQQIIIANQSNIYNHITNINQSIFVKLDEILTEIQNIDFNTTELENLILNLNTTLHSHMDANNLTVMTKLYSIQTELQQIINNQSNIYNHISNVNQSIFNKLIDLEVDLSDILANQTRIFNLLTYVNNSLNNLQTSVTTILANQVDILNNQTNIYNKLLSLEIDINNVLNNQTNILNYLIQHNSTVMTKLYGIQDELAYILNNQSNIYNYLVAHNQSVLNELLDLQIDVDNILSNQTTINTHITDINVTLMNELYYIESLLGNISINTTYLENLIINTNQTIMTKLYGVQDELSWIMENQTIIKQILYDHNTTIYDKLLEVQGNLVYISNQINNTNQTLYDMIYGTNLTIMTKLYGVQDELANITDLINVSINLIYNTNETIMTYLYSMNFTLWEEIYNIWNNLANMTNISMEITANMTTLPKEVYLYFQTVEERLIHNNDFCTVNGTTHRKELLTEKCVAGECFNITKNIDEVCPYGCVQGACLPTPTIKYSIFIIAILLMLGFMYTMYQIARRV